MFIHGRGGFRVGQIAAGGQIVEGACPAPDDLDVVRRRESILKVVFDAVDHSFMGLDQDQGPAQAGNADRVEQQVLRPLAVADDRRPLGPLERGLERRGRALAQDLEPRANAVASGEPAQVIPHRRVHLEADERHTGVPQRHAHRIIALGRTDIDDPVTPRSRRSSRPPGGARTHTFPGASATWYGSRRAGSNPFPRKALAPPAWHRAAWSGSAEAAASWLRRCG